MCFAYNNLLTTLVIGVVEDLARFVPTVGSLIETAIGILTFYSIASCLSPIRMSMCIGTGPSTFQASSSLRTHAARAW